MDDRSQVPALVGIPSEVVGMLALIFSEVLDGRNARLTGIWNPKPGRAA